MAIETIEKKRNSLIDKNDVSEGLITKNSTTYNIFRDSPLRYLGYANEVGESFRYQFPRFVRPSYVVAFGYCAMDAAACGNRIWNKPISEQKYQNPNKDAKDRDLKREAFIGSFDTLLWQSLASVMIPGVVINRIVRCSRYAVSNRWLALPMMISKQIKFESKSNQSAFEKWFPTTMGLCSIPFIVHPIDNFVDYLLDHTTRQYLYEYKGN